MGMSEIPVVILCGGQGTRMRGQTLTKKELVNVGGRPVIWHVMRIFSAHNFNRFVLTLGFQADQIKRYFLDYEAISRDFSVLVGNHDGQPHVEFHSQSYHLPWKVTLVDTGLHTEKASRIDKVRDYLDGDRFFVAYGDDVSNVDLSSLVSFHLNHGKTATITAVQIDLPFGVVEADESGKGLGFDERPRLARWINGGFMLFERSILDMLTDDRNINLEKEILPELARQGQLMVYKHSGFWQSMNTMKDNLLLEKLWQEGAPWRIW